MVVPCVSVGGDPGRPRVRTGAKEGAFPERTQDGESNLLFEDPGSRRSDVGMYQEFQ